MTTRPALPGSPATATRRRRLSYPRLSAPWIAFWAVMAAAVLAFLTLFFLWPVLALILRGFHGPDGWTLNGFGEVFTAARTWRVIRQTLVQATAATVACAVLAWPAAHLLYRRRFWGAGALQAALYVPFVMPTVVMGVAYTAVLRPGGALGWAHLEGTTVAVVAAMVTFNYPLMVRNLGTMWAAMDPRPAQAALALGAHPARVWLTVTVPMLAPALISAASVVFLFCATAFGIVLILGSRGAATLETEIYYQTTVAFNLQSAAVLSIVQLVVVAASLWMANRARQKAEKSLPVNLAQRLPALSRRDWPAALATAATMGVLAFPLVSLLARSFRRQGRWTVANYTDLADANSSRALLVSGIQAIFNSLTVAAAASVIAIVVAAAVALLLSRHPRRWRTRMALQGLDTLIMLPLGVSAVTLGFGYLLSLHHPSFDLRSSWWLVPIAQAMVSIPLVVRVVLPVMRAIDPHTREAATVLGASPWRVLATVDLPTLGRTLGVGAGFAMATSLGEFGATSFLVRPQNPTLPVVIFRLISRPEAQNQGMAVAASVILALLSALIMVTLERVQRQPVGAF